MRNNLKIFVITFLFQLYVVLSENAQFCKLRNDTESKRHILQRLFPLYGKKYDVEHEGTKYTIAICSDVSEKYAEAGVVKSRGANMEILAMRNDTDVISGDSWVLLTYGNGTKGANRTACNTTRVQIIITCSEETDDHPLHFLEFNEGWDPLACSYMFELHTSLMCPLVGLSNGSVFCIIFLTSVGLYLLIGIAYRRLIGGAKGLEQIPHYEFWKDLGNLQADGCNFVCRRDVQREESWRRLTSNFNDPQDDAMLRP